MRLRPYQTDMNNAALAEFGRVPSTCIVAPTGTGKAVSLADMAVRWPGRRTLLLAHRRKLLVQAGKHWQRMTGTAAPLECGEDRLNQWEIESSRFVLASKDSLHDGRLPKFKPELFDLVITDECHHASPANVTYMRPINHFRSNPACRFLGFTATIDRGDRSAIVGPGKTFETCCYEYPLYRSDGTPSAIPDGWLVPLWHEYITCVNLDFSKLKTVAGDYTDADLERILATEQMLHEMAAPLVEKVGGRPTIVFCATKAHAAGVHKAGEPERPGMVDVLNGLRPGSARSILGETPDDEREQYYAAFRRGEIQFLVGCDVMTEGLDLPEAAAVAICRPTKSRNRYAQMAGRATRPLEELAELLNQLESALERRALIAGSRKPNAVIYDFVGCGNLKLSVSVAELLADSDGDDPIVKRAKQKTAKGNGSADMAKSLQEAQAELWQEASASLIKDYSADLEKRCRALAETVQYQTQVIDPFDRYQSTPAAASGPAPKRTATDKQVSLLVGLGVREETAAGYSIRQAAAVIDNLSAKRCTARQAKTLEKFGYDPAGHNLATARAVIDELAANGWKRV